MWSIMGWQRPNGAEIFFDIFISDEREKYLAFYDTKLEEIREFKVENMKKKKKSNSRK